ncbi:Gfo/Idh/MocA family protein [Salipaludibacillus keqinensis]|nr:Gfo/Idh/MocA family oxidoreductase [Salipaludibacillus keqinensis]
MINLALVGAWHVHTEGFVQDALNTGEANLTVVWDDDELRGKAMAETFDVPFESELDKVLQDPSIHAVIVEAATTIHKEVIIRCAKAKKHIFSDKALALSVEDCLEIKEAIDENNVKFVVSLESKVYGTYRYAKDLIEEGKLGKVTGVYFRRTHQAAVDKTMLPAYWFNQEETGGGVTLDLGCHGLYLLPYFCGNPKKVTCLMNELYGTGSDENSTTIIEFEEGAIGTAHTSYVSSRLDNLLEIIGTEGSVLITGKGAGHFKMFLQSNHLQDHEELTAVSNDHLPASEEMPSAQFVRLVSSPERTHLPEFDIDTGIALSRMIECAYESAKQGKAVWY